MRKTHWGILSKYNIKLRTSDPILGQEKVRLKFAVPTLTSLTDFLGNLPTLLLWDEIWNAEMIAIIIKVITTRWQIDFKMSLT